LTQRFSSLDDGTNLDLAEATLRRNAVVLLIPSPDVSRAPVPERVEAELLQTFAPDRVIRRTSTPGPPRNAFAASFVVDIDDDLAEFASSLELFATELEGRRTDIYEDAVCRIAAWSLAAMLRVMPYETLSLFVAENTATWTMLRYGLFAWFPPFGMNRLEQMNLFDAYERALHVALNNPIDGTEPGHSALDDPRLDVLFSFVTLAAAHAHV
jgi:hypothetical protein